MTPLIVANTLLLEADWQAGQTQLKLLESLAKKGFDTIEVRREYFRSPEQEIPELAEKARELNVALYYSVPAQLVVDGALNAMLETYFDEAKTLGAKKIKLNIGNYTAFSGDLAESLRPLTTRGVEVNVENDQSKLNGTVEPIADFLQKMQEESVDIRFVFDIGNWPFAGVDLVAAAKALKTSVRYIHIKDVAKKGDALQVVPLDQGSLAWREALKRLPSDVPVALEYPTTLEALATEETLLNKALN